MTRDVNEMQVDGDHYMKLEYQHWDFVNDMNLDYFYGNITKYLSRSKEDSDIEKAIHYLRKAQSLGRHQPDIPSSRNIVYQFHKYIGQLGTNQKMLMVLVFAMEPGECAHLIDAMLGGLDWTE